MKSKIIQTITAWQYPCEGKPFYFRDGLLELNLAEPTKTERKLKKDTLICPCGKNCKPRKIEIEVREIK